MSDTPQPSAPVSWDMRPDEEKTKYITSVDPGFARHHREMCQFLDKQNEPQRISLTTFDYYAPLFSHEAQKTMPIAELMEINRQYWANIDQYRPVIVEDVDPETGEKLHLFTLPRLWTQFGIDGRLLDRYKYAAANANMKRKDDPLAQTDGRRTLGDMIELQYQNPENIRRVATIVAETRHIKAFIDGIRSGTTEASPVQGGSPSAELSIEMDFYED